MACPFRNFKDDLRAQPIRVPMRNHAVSDHLHWSGGVAPRLAEVLYQAPVKRVTRND